MFLEFYGLSEQPFGSTPDLRFLYLSEGHKEALASLIYGLETGAGFLALVGKPGCGKTTLLYQVLERFRESSRTVFLFQTQCTPRELIRHILSDLGLEAGSTDSVNLHDQFRDLLVQEAERGRKVIVVVDEAQHLRTSVLETLRLLSNFETPQQKLVQFVLSGQPELAGKLLNPTMSQFSQRIFTLVRLEPLPAAEVPKYIQHRLRAAGYRGEFMFSPEACQLIAERTGGIARLINNICYNALALGCALRQPVLDVGVIEEVLKDADLSAIASGGAASEPQPKRRKRAAPRKNKQAAVETISEDEVSTATEVVDSQDDDVEIDIDAPLFAQRPPGVPAMPGISATTSSLNTPERMASDVKAEFNSSVLGEQASTVHESGSQNLAAGPSQPNLEHRAATRSDQVEGSFRPQSGVVQTGKLSSTRSFQDKRVSNSTENAQPVVEIDSLARDYFLLDATIYRPNANAKQNAPAANMHKPPIAVQQRQPSAAEKPQNRVQAGEQSAMIKPQPVPVRPPTPAKEGAHSMGRFLSYVAILLLILALLLAWGISRVLVSVNQDLPEVGPSHVVAALQVPSWRHTKS